MSKGLSPGWISGKKTMSLKKDITSQSCTKSKCETSKRLFWCPINVKNMLLKIALNKFGSKSFFYSYF
jgi:hypothetical protein